MPLNTRAKKREPVPASCELALNEAAAKAIRLNIPHSPASGEKIIIKACLIDISVSGCAIDAPYLIPAGILLDIKIDTTPFTIETEKEPRGPIELIGKVTSCIMLGRGHYRMGICFADINKDDVDLINDFIKVKEKRKDPRWDMTK